MEIQGNSGTSMIGISQEAKRAVFRSVGYAFLGRWGSWLLIRVEIQWKFRDRLRNSLFLAVLCPRLGLTAAFGGAEQASQQGLQLPHEPARSAGMSSMRLTPNALEDTRPPVPPLRHVMRIPGHHDSCHPAHKRVLTQPRPRNQVNP
jgi:hypothetical protein